MKSKIHEHQKNNKILVSKKFVFSAIAMMAFSVGAIAETKKEILPVEKEIVKNEVVNQTSVDLEFSTDLPNCDAERLATLAAAGMAGWGHDTAVWMSYNVYFSCMQRRAEILFGP